MSWSWKYWDSFSNETSWSNQSDRRYEKYSTSSDEYSRAVTAGSDETNTSTSTISSRRDSLRNVARRSIKGSGTVARRPLPVARESTSPVAQSPVARDSYLNTK